MQDSSAVKIHWSFWLISGIATIWNLMGIMNFFIQMNAGIVASLPETQRELIQNRPMWATMGFGLAVFGGAIGSILLLLKKEAAKYFFILSTLGVIVQIPPYFLTNNSSNNVMYIVMPLIVTIFLIWYSRQARSKGWLK